MYYNTELRVGNRNFTDSSYQGAGARSQWWVQSVSWSWTKCHFFNFTLSNSAFLHKRNWRKLQIDVSPLRLQVLGCKNDFEEIMSTSLIWNLWPFNINVTYLLLFMGPTFRCAQSLSCLNVAGPKCKCRSIICYPDLWPVCMCDLSLFLCAKYKVLVAD